MVSRFHTRTESDVRRSTVQSQALHEEKETLYLQEDWKNEMRMDVVYKLTNTRIHV